jgi:Flp pilus assembly protein TadG
VQKKTKSQRGASLITFTLLLAFLLLPLMGLGIDSSIQYWITTRLSSAVDSAVLAAARSLNTGATSSAQITNAQAVGRQYFAANFPTGTLGTTVFGGQQVSNAPTISVVQNTNFVTVTATAQVNAPLYFLKVLHLSSGTITATSQSTRRYANIILVLDRSGSMNNASNSCAALVSAVQSFTNNFINGSDQVGMITFSTSANMDYWPTVNFNPGLNNTINSLVCVGATSTPQALTMAYAAIESINEPDALNIILLFTDGQANAVIASYPVKTQGDNRYDAVNTGTTEYIGPSSCYSSAAIVGGHTDFSGSANPTGYTGGIYSISPAPSITQGSSDPPAVSAPGCAFSSNSYNAFGNYNVPYARYDIAYVPTTDIYGNSTVGYKPSQTFTSGPYAGQIRTDSPLAIRYAAMNAADSISSKIRSDSTYHIVTYTIGLAGNEAIPMDTDFLERIANDPRASNYNSSQPQGMFALANNNAQLADAFNLIASQIIRLSR